MSTTPAGAATFTLRLPAGDEVLDLTVTVPTAPARVEEMLPLLHALEEAVTAAAVRAVEARGKTISCRAGCGACCRQLVPVSEPEARHLAAVVEAMPPARRAAVRARFASALAALDRAGLLARLRAARTDIDLATSPTLATDYFRAGVACPFLENESCGIHPDRPLTCREYLVTSPATECANPDPARIEKVPIPAKLSVGLYRFRQGDEPRWVPLVLALEWVASAEAGQGDEPRPGPELLRDFLDALGAEDKT